MMKVPSLDYHVVVRALRRAGWVVVRQRGSHIRLQKSTPDVTLKIIVPAHRPIKRSTLSHILKRARMDVEAFNKLLSADEEQLAPVGI
jgi:predicted RNA binding protein YcfA (HicA-like mRNA interferase family)